MGGLRVAQNRPWVENLGRDTQNSTQEQLNRLIEFRQTIYDQFLTARRDAQFETLDALLLKGRIASFAWLSTAGCFQRKWPSLYDALEQGQQDVAGLQSFLVGQVAKTGLQFWSLDGSAWPRLQARTLPERESVYAPGRGFKGKPVVPGYTYSFLDWAPQAGESWSLSVDVERVKPERRDVLVGAAQLKRLCAARAGLTGLVDIVAADCKYSGPEFLREVQPLAWGKVARLAKHRVLYGRPEPKPAGSRGRPRKHGVRFAFKEPATWGEPVEELALQHRKWGQVKLRRWPHLHGRSAADVEFDVVQAQVHLERNQPPGPLWLLWLPPEPIPPTVTLTLETIWQAYDHRWRIEFNFRDAKQCWGLEDFMNVNQTPVYNAANLAMFMVNLSQVLIGHFRPTCPTFSVNDLKAYFRGRKYVTETLKLLPQRPEPIFIDQIFANIAQIGSINAS